MCISIYLALTAWIALLMRPGWVYPELQMGGFVAAMGVRLDRDGCPGWFLHFIFLSTWTSPQGNQLFWRACFVFGLWTPAYHALAVRAFSVPYYYRS
jgi:hypothetical protein